MPKGLELFRRAFEPFTDCYVLIGGAACSIILEQIATAFRVTKDLDIVLSLEKPILILAGRSGISSNRAVTKYKKRTKGKSLSTVSEIRSKRNTPFSWNYSRNVRKRLRFPLTGI